LHNPVQKQLTRIANGRERRLNRGGSDTPTATTLIFRVAHNLQTRCEWRTSDMKNAKRIGPVATVDSAPANYEQFN
jgi:hypothetical protein